MYKIIGLFLMLSLTLGIASCGNNATAEKTTKAPIYVNMPENTEIAVTLVDSIDTDFQTTGTQFRATLLRPIIVDGYTLFAEGTQAKGILDKVVESGRLTTPAELDFSLIALQDKSGQWVKVNTIMIKEKKDSHTDREVAMIGGGAVVGGIIGKIVDKKGSTEIGAAAGAAAGTGLSAATGKRDIFHETGTEVVFFTSQSMQIALE